MRNTTRNRNQRIRLQKIGNRLRRDAKQQRKARRDQARAAKTGG